MTTRYTPVYSIPVPGSDDKPKDFSDQIWALGLGVEAALQAASIPGTSNPDIRVSATAAARDAYFGTPATEAARLALQARGATTLRTDKGWTERYFATYNASTNPQGATPAGWYPIDGALPTFSVRRGAPQTFTGSTGFQLIDAAFGAPRRNNGVGTLASGVLTIAQAGWYQGLGYCRLSAANQPFGTQVTRNSSVATLSDDTLFYNAPAGAGIDSQGSGLVRLKVGDTLRMYTFAPNGGSIGPFLQDVKFDLVYVSPPFGPAA